VRVAGVRREHHERLPLSYESGVWAKYRLADNSGTSMRSPASLLMDPVP
jgi:hypothetical protein